MLGWGICTKRKEGSKGPPVPFTSKPCEIGLTVTGARSGHTVALRSSQEGKESTSHASNIRCREIMSGHYSSMRVGVETHAGP